MQHLNMSTRNTIVGLAALLLWAGVFSCAQKHSALLPTNLKGLRLQNTVQGQAAEAMINRLHNKEVTAKDNYIGHYQGQGAKAVLYVSKFQSQQEAEALLASMSDRIKTNSNTFGHFRRMSARGLTVYSVLGLGQVHYFYQEGHVLIWLAVDPTVAQETFEAVLANNWDASFPGFKQ